MRKLNGIVLPHHKKTKDAAPVRMPPAKESFYPMHQNIGAPAVPAVKVGDCVKVGTLIAEAGGFVSSPIYSGVSGKVKKIEDMVQPGGAYSPTVVIESDGLQTAEEAEPPVVTCKEDFLRAVQKSGAVGLGGAGFPTAVKLTLREESAVDCVIINGAECEPYITSDTRTMLDSADDICEGIELIRKHLGIQRFIIGIEKNKPACISNMKKTAGALSGVTVEALPTLYPQGGEKVLIYHTTGRVVEEGKLPLDVGVIVINCTTLAFLARYMRTGMPLTEKCITVDGGAVKEPKNVIAPIGTPAAAVFDFCGGLEESLGKVVFGGPMMGIAASDLCAPVLKQTNAILALTEKESAPQHATNCIRCGRCTNTCPFGLAPVSMVTAYEKGDMEALARFKANLCMECGCCSFVCPAHRPLVQQNKLAKAALNKWMKDKKEKEEKK